MSTKFSLPFDKISSADRPLSKLTGAAEKLLTAYCSLFLLFAPAPLLRDTIEPLRAGQFVSARWPVIFTFHV
jgi:hypothetical protein